MMTLTLKPANSLFQHICVCVGSTASEEQTSPGQRQVFRCPGQQWRRDGRIFPRQRSSARRSRHFR